MTSGSTQRSHNAMPSNVSVCFGPVVSPFLSCMGASVSRVVIPPAPIFLIHRRLTFCVPTSLEPFDSPTTSPATWGIRAKTFSKHVGASSLPRPGKETVYGATVSTVSRKAGRQPRSVVRRRSKPRRSSRREALTDLQTEMMGFLAPLLALVPLLPHPKLILGVPGRGPGTRQTTHRLGAGLMVRFTT